MARVRSDLFTTIRSEGGLLPVDLLARIAGGEKQLEGLRPEDYDLDAGDRLGEAAARAWNALLPAWVSFRDGLAALPSDDKAQGLTRDRFLLPLFRALGWGRLPVAQTIVAGGKSFPISHERVDGETRIPLHLVGANVPIGTRSAGVRGAAGASPHSMVQELLNLSDERLWGVVTNGHVLRILRDNRSLTRQAFLEFDLRAMMEGQVYGDFRVLFLVLHVSRFTPRGESRRPESCLLEQWSQRAQADGTRYLADLRVGVETAIKELGEGFLERREAAGNRAIVQHTHTDDKQMGPWFVRARTPDHKVEPQEFASKVLFYLWSDVFRDEPGRIFRDEIETYDQLVRVYLRDKRPVFNDGILTGLLAPPAVAPTPESESGATTAEASSTPGD